MKHLFFNHRKPSSSLSDSCMTAVVFILGKFVALRAQCGTPDFMCRGVRRFSSGKKILASIFSRDFISYWKKWKKSRWKKLLSYLVFRDTCMQYTRTCRRICKAPKFSMGFLGVNLLIGSGDFLDFRFKPEVFFCGFRLCPNSHLPVT